MIDFEFIGWCNEDNHDKVWVSFYINNSFYCAWGKRGAKLSFKRHPSYPELYKVQRSKEKRYKPVDQFMLFSIFPNFEDKVGEELMLSMLSNKVK